MLSENYFMDNKSDLEYLQNQTGKQAIIDTHVEGIEEIFISSKNQSLAEHSDVLFSYTSLIINVIVHPFSAFSIASMASVLAFSVKSM